MKKRQAYALFLRSYLIVLIVPILIMICGYIYSNKMVGEEASEYQNTIIKKTQGIGDQIISNHMLSKGALLSNKHLKNLMNEEEWSGPLMFDVVELKNVLMGMKNSNYLMEDVQVYFPQSGDLLTTQRRYPEQLTYIYTDGVEMERPYAEIIDYSKARGYYVHKPGTDDCTLYFYENTFARNYHDVLASIVTVLKWTDVESMLGDIGSNSVGTVFLINTKDEILGNSNPGLDISHIKYSDFEDVEEPIYTTIDGESYICSYMDSTVIDLKYVICIPKRVYYQKNNFLLLVIALDLVVCVVTGVSLAIYFAKKSSNPIENLLLKMNTSKKNAEQIDYKVFDHLGNALSTMADDYENMEKQLEDRNVLLHEKMLASLLNGRRQNSAFMSDYIGMLEKRMEQEWGSACYRVIAVGFNNLEDSIFVEEGSTISEDIISLAFFSAENVFKETILNNSWGPTLETDNAIVCITKSSDDLADKLKEYSSFFNQIFNLKVYAAISKEHVGVSELSVAYDEAIKTENFKCFWEDEVEDVLFYEENSEEQDVADSGNYAEDIKKMNNCVAAREYEAARELLFNYLEETLKKDIKNMSMNRCNASGIISFVINMINGLEGDAADEMCKKYNLPERLLKAESIHQLMDDISLIFDEMIACDEESSEEYIPKKVVDAKAYIDENFADINLSISALADSFDMSLSYMGRMFKKYTGNGILGYLHMVRVENCKKLLDEGKSVKDAAALSGFIDSKSMIRTFRKYEGITPGQYKKQKM